MEKILSINLATQTAPRVSEQAGKDWIDYGTDEWANLYPQFLIDLYYNSSTHAAIINATRDMIAGEGLIVEEHENTDAYVKLQQFVNNANGKESLHDIIKKIAFDYKLQGGFALNVIWNKTRTEIAEIHHVPVEKIRAGKPNEYGVVDTYWVSSDWSDIRKNKPAPMPAFNMNDRTSPSQIMYDGDYSPNMDIYFTPDYSAGCNWALVDQKVSEFHLSNITQGFSGSYFVNFANGVPTQQERIEIENSLINKFAGAKASGKIVLTFSDDATKVPQITPIAVSNADKQYLALQELLVQNILTAHRVTSPMLMGIKNETGLGSNVDELNSAFEVYLNTIVKPYQTKIMKCLGKIFEINKMNVPVEFIQNKPITTKFTLEDMKSVMTQDEIREELGLPPLESDEQVEEDDFSKFNITDWVNNIDGYPIFETKEEAEEKAKEMGCEGSHKHEDSNGKVWYMPCKDHSTVTTLHSNESLLDFIKTYGEDSPGEDWGLLSDEVVIDEHEDFDFEKELNKLHKIEFATKPSASAIISDGGVDERDESQDGEDREQNLYKVRYRYSTAIASGNSRQFCVNMLNNNRIYRKEHIKSMNSEMYNPGFGPGGNSSYSIWLYKGGPQCGHYWRREIYFYKLGEATGEDISDATKIITTTEARSKGFYPEANAPEVSRAPKNMPNNGYKNPR